MKKSIFTICTILFVLPIISLAQPITLGIVDSGTYLNVSMSSLGVETDTLASVDMSTAIFPTFSAHLNYNWDLTNLFYTSSHRVGFIAGVSPYQNIDTESYTMGPVHYFAYNDNFFVYDGWKSDAQNLDSQTIILKRAHDSTIIATNFAFNYRLVPGTNNSIAYKINLPFPTTLNTTWGSVYSFIHLFRFKDSDPTMNDTSYKNGYHARYATESSDVIGYGMMKINAKDSTPTRLFHVLQIRVVKSYTDSIVIPNGVPARLYDSMGLAKAYTHKIYEMDFRTTQLLSPLARFIFTDSTMSVVQSAEISIGNLSKIDDSTAGVTVLTNSGAKMQVYPNPAVNGQVYIEIPNAQTGNWSYQLYNISGQVLSTGIMPLGNGTNKAQIVLPSNITGGVYYISVNHDGNKEATTPLLIAK